MSQGLDQVFSKKLQKLWHFVKNHKNVSISPKLATFLCKLPCLRVLTMFLEKSSKTMAFCEKPQKRVDLAKTSTFFVQTTMFQGADQIFGKKLQKLWDFVKKTQKRINLEETSNFLVQTTMFQGFDQVFSKKLQILLHFVKNHKNVSISPKIPIFVCKIPYFRGFIHFLEETCKNYGIL